MSEPTKLSKDDELQALRSEIDRLNAALKVANDQNDESTRRAAFFSNQEAVPTGRYVIRKMAFKPWEKDEDDQDWREVKVPTYMMLIDMPAVGGIDLKLNGESFQHNSVYELDEYQVRVVKEIVYRLQAHEASIKGHDDDSYRPRISKEISLKHGTIKSLPPNWVPGIPVSR